MRRMDKLGLVALLAIAVLLCGSTVMADITEWEYKMATEHPELEVKCTQVLWNKCLSWNWRNREDKTFTRIRAMVSAEDQKPPMQTFAPDAQGLIKIPVIACKKNVAGATHKWVPIDNGKPDVPKVWLQAQPEAGVSAGTSIKDQPMIGCNVAVTADQAGKYILWMRGGGPDASSDSINYGVNGVRVGALTFLNQPWSKDRQSHSDDAIVQLNAGSLELDIWMREDSTKIMIIVLTKDSTYIPKDEDFAR